MFNPHNWFENNDGLKGGPRTRFWECACGAMVNNAKSKTTWDYLYPCPGPMVTTGEVITTAA